MTQKLPPPLPWFKQFWPWFLLMLPLAAVTASLVTVAIAIKQPEDRLPLEARYLGNILIQADPGKPIQQESAP